MEHLLTTDEAAKIGRPINGKIDHERILAYITEAEQMNIKPVLGDRLFLDILQNGEVNEQYKVLLNGGTYTAKDGGQKCHGRRLSDYSLRSGDEGVRLRLPYLHQRALRLLQ